MGGVADFERLRGAVSGFEMLLGVVECLVRLNLVKCATVFWKCMQWYA